MARMLIAALRTGGHDVAMASDFRSFLPSPDPDAMRDREATALHEVERLIVEWQDSPNGPPDVWFTYHPYYKAPDLIGAKVAVRFGMTYVTAEASHAGETRCRSLGQVARRQRSRHQGGGAARLLHGSGCRGAGGPRRPRSYHHAASVPRPRPFRRSYAPDARLGPRAPRDGRDDAAGRQGPAPTRSWPRRSRALPPAYRGISRSSVTGRSASWSSACSAAFRPKG